MPNDGDVILRSSLPQALRDLTGDGVKAAVIDSGICSGHPHVGRTEDGVSFFINADQAVERGDDFSDRTGHGTACAAVIRGWAPEVGLLAVRILDDDLSSRTGLLVQGIDWARRQCVDVISMSLGTYREESWNELEQAVLRADEAGIVLVASTPDIYNQPAPARFPAVISAAPDFRFESFGFISCEDDRKIADFVAYPFPREALGIGRLQNFRGPSFASAHLAGIACLIREQRRGLPCREVRAILNGLSGRFHPFDRSSVSEERIQTQRRVP